jgi:hypothetical protein
MKVMWYWRCKMDAPMLDEEEFRLVSGLHSEGIKAIKKYGETNKAALDETPIELLQAPMREKYKELTGFEETNHTAILHHRISSYGGPCKKCGKPMRTPQAAFCAACGGSA